MLTINRKPKRKPYGLGLALIGLALLGLRWGKAWQRKAKPKAEPPAEGPSDPEGAEDQTVYITDMGNKYHRASCIHLHNSRQPLKKSEAVLQGYEACGVCKP